MSINQEIEILRLELKESVENNEGINQKVLKKSNELDTVINRYYRQVRTKKILVSD
jgi:hypothetical protein